MDDCTVNSMAGEEDIYADTRARSSPVVERLILQEIQNDIAEYAANIGISTGTPNRYTTLMFARVATDITPTRTN